MIFYADVSTVGYCVRKLIADSMTITGDKCKLEYPKDDGEIVLNFIPTPRLADWLAFNATLNGHI